MLSPQERRELHKIIVEVAREGGEIAMRWFGRTSVRSKENVEIVTEADSDVEALIVRRLREETGYAVLGEELGHQGENSGDGGPLWVVDPIDGTTNFAHGVPHFAMSIGLWHEGALLGVIHNPATGECISTDGGSLMLNARIVEPPRSVQLSNALVATGFPYDRQIVDDDNTREFRAVMKRARGVRRNGAAALDLAWVAAGRFNAFWEPRLKPWDVVAGIALAQAIGAEVSTMQGEPWTMDGDGSIVVAPSPLHGELMKLLKEIRQ